MGLDRFKGQYIQETAEDRERRKRFRQVSKSFREGVVEGGCWPKFKHNGAYGDNR